MIVNRETHYDLFCSLLRINHDPALVDTFLNDLYTGIIHRTHNKILDAFGFQELTHMPMIVAEKVFTALNTHNNGRLSKSEFTEGYTTLYSGTLDDKVKLISLVFDFDSDEVIHSSDIFLLLSHFHMVDNSLSDVYLVEDVISDFFQNKESLSVTEFISMTYTCNSDLYFLFLIFLFKYRPFNDNQIMYYSMLTHSVCKASEEKSFSHMKLAAPTQKLINACKILFNNSLIDINEESDKDLEHLNIFEQDFSEAISLFEGSNDMKECNAIKGEEKKKRGANEKLNNFFTSRSSKRAQSNKTVGEPYLVGKLETKKNNQSKSSSDLYYQKGDKMINIQGGKEFALYAMGNNDKLKKCKLIVIDDVIFYLKYYSYLGVYKKKRVLSLTKTYIKECLPCQESGVELYPMQLVSTINNSEYTKAFLSEDTRVIKDLISTIRENMKHRSIKGFYTFEKLVGCGKFSKVYLGMNKLTGQQVAIKTVKKVFTPKTQIDALYEITMREDDIFNFLKNFNHPHIIHPIEIFHSAHHIHYVYEYISGGDMKAYLSHNKLSVTDIMRISGQLLQAVACLHKFGIVHRDIKLQNILLANTDKNELEIKIIDFGLSKVMGVYETTSEPYGTLAYTAPEILLESPYNHKVDVWSIGVLIYYLGLGKYPFDDLDKVDKQSLTWELEIPSEYECISELIRACLEKNVEKRSSIQMLVN